MSEADRPIPPEIDLSRKNLPGYSSLITDLLVQRTQDPDFPGKRMAWRSRLSLAKRDARVAKKMILDMENHLNQLKMQEDGEIKVEAVRLYYGLDLPGSTIGSYDHVCNGLNTHLEKAIGYVDLGMTELGKIFSGRI